MSVCRAAKYISSKSRIPISSDATYLDCAGFLPARRALLEDSKTLEILPRAAARELASPELDLKLKREKGWDVRDPKTALKTLSTKENLMSQLRKGVGVLNSSTGRKPKQAPRASSAPELDFFFGLQSGPAAVMQPQGFGED